MAEEPPRHYHVLRDPSTDALLYLGGCFETEDFFDCVVVVGDKNNSSSKRKRLRETFKSHRYKVLGENIFT